MFNVATNRNTKNIEAVLKLPHIGTGKFTPSSYNPQLCSGGGNLQGQGFLAHEITLHCEAT